MILALDPSLSATGYCVIGGDGITVLDYGLIETDSDNKLCERVYKITERLEKIINEQNVKTIVSEDQYGHFNPDTLKKLSHVRGQIMYLASKYDLDMYIFAPSSMKKIVTGKGNCKKEEVAKSLRKDYHIVDRVDEDLVKKDNISDAFGIAVSYFKKPEKARKIN